MMNDQEKELLKRDLRPIVDLPIPKGIDDSELSQQYETEPKQDLTKSEEHKTTD